MAEAYLRPRILSVQKVTQEHNNREQVAIFLSYRQHRLIPVAPTVGRSDPRLEEGWGRFSLPLQFSNQPTHYWVITGQNGLYVASALGPFIPGWRPSLCIVAVLRLRRIRHECSKCGLNDGFTTCSSVNP